MVLEPMAHHGYAVVTTFPAGLSRQHCPTWRRPAIASASSSLAPERWLRRPSGQLTRVRNVQTAILGLPLMERCAADTVLATYFARRQTTLLLSQTRYSLLFAKSAASHVHLLRWTLLSNDGPFGAQVTVNITFSSPPT
jgi:hypothetical protein